MTIRIKIYSTIFLATLIAVLLVGLTDVHKSIELHALQSTQQRFGSGRLAPEHEDKIKAIVSRMNVTVPLIIRTINRNALLTFGYHNAFVYFPKFLDIIPVSTTPFLFVSEGFFADLSPEEQLFLIGHELIHAQKHHTLYLNLIIIVLFLFLVGIYWVFIRKYCKRLIFHFVVCSYRNIALIVTSFLSIGLLGLPVNLIEKAYRRSIERDADESSLKILASYDGCCKLIDRWEKEFKLPLHNSYGGLVC